MNDIFSICNETDFMTKKELRRADYVQYMMLRTRTMFDWRGLPDTIPARILEMLLQCGGNACIFEFEGSMYATFGGLGGELDYNYEPTLYVIANPYLNYSAELRIGTECVRMRNDDYGKGLLPMYMRYASMMTENDISIVISSINTRITRGIVADNDTAYESAKNFLDKIIKGHLAPMMSDEFFEGIHALENAGSNEKLTDLIELQQYFKASWFNEVGLNSNYNMKRERIAAPEAQMTDDALLPLVDMMLETRRAGCEEVNELFGTEWSVDLAGAWLREHLKQQVPGLDFDSDGDTQIAEEDVETTDEAAGSNSDKDLEGSDNTENIVETTEENGGTTDGGEDNATDSDTTVDGGDDGADGDADADGSDEGSDISIAIDITNVTDSENVEVKEDEDDEHDDARETETAD